MSCAEGGAVFQHALVVEDIHKRIIRSVVRKTRAE